MILIRPLAVLLMGAVALAACDRQAAGPVEPVSPETASVSAASTAPPVDYGCGSGKTIRVQYVDAETAQVTYQDQTHAMRIALSGSGARYVGSGLEWWTASRNGQESATLSRIGPNDAVGTVVLERCSRPSTNPDLPEPGPLPVTATVAGAPCRTTDLRLIEGEADGGAGSWIQVLALTNAGSAPCSLSGYPAVSLLDADGRPVSGVRADQKSGTSEPVMLAAGGSAVFDIGWSVVPDEAQGQTICPTVARVTVRLGADTTSLALPLSFAPCGGRIGVSPVRATEEIVTARETA